MSKSYDVTELPKSNVVSLHSEDATIGEPGEVDLERFSKRTRALINPPFEDSVGSEDRLSAINALLREGATPEEVLGVLVDASNKINLRANANKQITEAFARREIAKALAGQVKINPADDFSDEVDPKWLKDIGEPKIKKGKFAGSSLSQMLALPDPNWLIEGVITQGGLFEIFGQFKAGKTFYGLELALCIVTGRDFFDGVKTTKGRALYIIAEGNRKAFARRVDQWIKARADGDKTLREQYRKDIESGFRVVGVPVHLDMIDETKAFVLDNPGSWSAVFIDTLMRNMSGDPMKPADVIAFLQGCDRLRELPCEPAVIFLHHMRRENATGGYGPIVGEAFVDGACAVSRDGKKRILQVKLMRDADDNVDSWECHIEPVKIVVDFEKDIARSVGVLTFDRRGGVTPDIKLLITIYLHKPAKIADLTTTLGLARRTVDRLLQKLRNAGYVKDGGLGLTDLGRRMAEKEADNEAGDGE